MHERALANPVSRPWTRLRAWARRAATRPDVLLFSGAMAILALHAAVDSFIAPEPGTRPLTTCCEGRRRLRSSWLQRSLPAPPRGGARGPRGGLRCAGARGSHPGDRRRARRRRPRRGLDGFPSGSGRLLLLGRRSPALAFAQARPASLASPCRDRLGAVLAATGWSCRSRSRSSPRIVRGRMSARPTSAGHTRR